MPELKQPKLQGKKILIIEDDRGTRQILRAIFTQEGAEVFTAARGKEGLRQLYVHQPNLVLLDIMLPQVDGWEICRQIRQLTDVPIIMLTALIREQEIIRGLNIGADDYITKPFNKNILLARVQALFRRAAKSATVGEPAPHYNDGYLIIDVEGHRVLIEGNPLKLTVTEFDLLVYLFRHANRICTFKQILDNVWGQEYQGNTDYVHVYIWHLRRKLEKDPKEPVYLITEHTIGYRFAPQTAV